MTCKDGCLYEPLCKYNDGINEWCKSNCPLFKPKSSFVELPCEVGVKVYFAVLESDKCLSGQLCSFSLDAAHLWFNCHYDCGLNYWHPIENIGKTVFLSREEAEKTLQRKEDEGK